MTTMERFLAKVKTGEGCWEWQGTLNKAPFMEPSVPNNIRDLHNATLPVSSDTELWNIANPAWDAIEHGLRYEGVTSGPEIIIKAIKRAMGKQEANVSAPDLGK